ncbi:rRNA methyltransferase [Capsulimonas corticalis]|uniref:rRNA methyltransferase n=1 Tax=Capsulimonas corticalis TaxID=2219043 RepID=A0A402CP74_9BACT|nr:RNA methyltransferase [Capsulimonas corticalis]BDI33101.1 rRNA methyltransferase [Capsulimonas corticalis]
MTKTKATLTRIADSSRRDTVSLFDLLAQREARDRTHFFRIEGLRLFVKAMECGAEIQSAIVSASHSDTPAAQRALRYLQDHRIPTTHVSDECLARITQTEDPQGFAAIVRQRWESLADITPSADLCWVACESVRSPGNLGTIIRTGDSVGAGGVILLGKSTDPYAPLTVRASMGSIFAQRFIRSTFQNFATWKQQAGAHLIGTSPQGAYDYREVLYQRPTVLFMGSERKGLWPIHQSLCDELVRIPMAGSADSLNLAVAAGIMLFEIFRQNHPAPADLLRSG